MRFSYGENIRLFTSGGSHDPEMALSLFGFPAGFAPDMDALDAFMARRRPGNAPYATKRKESDIPHFLSGFENGVTTGDCIRAVICNENQRSGDYEALKDVPRPSHADYAAIQKYGQGIDLRGGGHFSGRLTALLCVAGGLAKQLLEKEYGIRIFAHISALHGVLDTPLDPENAGASEADRISRRSFPTFSEEAEQKMLSEIENARLMGDSVGGIITCAAVGLPAGLGEHMFGSAEARISAAVFAVPAVKGIEFGAGFRVSELRGSENNDPFRYENGILAIKKNNAGGILGGMTSGAPLVFSVAVKPTPSIAMEQDSVSLSRKENCSLAIKGRHDPCILPRAVPVVEAVTALAVLDMLCDKDEDESD